MPIETRICKKCGNLFTRYFSPAQDKKDWGLYCSKSCSISVQKTVHGHYAGDQPSSTYVTWQSMRQRCNDPHSDRFYAYGAIGITVCDEWCHSFEQFLADMGERPKGCTLDRIDNTKGYSPDNCRWATPKQQSHNRKSNVLVNFQGSLIPCAEAARRCGLSKTLLYDRLKRGWPEDRLFDPPMGKRKVPPLPSVA